MRIYLRWWFVLFFKFIIAWVIAKYLRSYKLEIFAFSYPNSWLYFLKTRILRTIHAFIIYGLKYRVDKST